MPRLRAAPSTALPRATVSRAGRAGPIIGSALLCAAVALSCSPRRPAADPDADREAVLIAQDRLWDAFARQNLDDMGRYLDADAVLLGEKNLEGRAAIVSFLKSWFRGLEIHGWEHTRRNVRMIEETAVISYWRDESGLADGAPYRVSGWVSEIWSRRSGSWLALLIHIGANQAAET